MELFYFKTLEEATAFAAQFAKVRWKRVTVSRAGYQYIVGIETLASVSQTFY